MVRAALEKRGKCYVIHITLGFAMEKRGKSHVIQSARHLIGREKKNLPTDWLMSFTESGYLSFLFGEFLFQLVLMHYKADVNAPDNDGNTPLHLCTANGHEKVRNFFSFQSD